jgi:hypothetical protein
MDDATVATGLVLPDRVFLLQHADSNAWLLLSQRASSCKADYSAADDSHVGVLGIHAQ